MARHTARMGVGSTWAIEGALNPTVLRVHVRVSLTDRTIETCPPGTAPAPLDRLLAVEAVRSLDLHRYRVRVNLRPGGGRGAVMRRTAEVLGAAWGSAAALPPDPPPRVFAHPYEGTRIVVESAEMAGSSGVPALVAVFAASGVVEAIAAPGMVLVRIGRLFSWEEAEPAVVAALAQ
jgi:hypothetical protein